MKGLLLKDFYMALKYCRALLFVMLFFMVFGSIFAKTNTFFPFFPTLFAGLLPMTLISYDEREKWDEYSQALPCSKAQTVSAKYLLGLILVLAVTAVSAALQAIGLHYAGEFDTDAYLMLITQMLAIGMIAPSVLLPFVFKFGAEKGRLIYLCVLGAIGAFIAIVSLQPPQTIQAGWVAVIVLIATAAVYALSWLLSVYLYNKREV